MGIDEGEREIRIGMSGWRYAPWRGVFYPKGLRQADELAYASSHVTSIEINGSFYSLQRPSSWRAWVEQTPDDFVFSVKAPRYITHLLQLREPATAIANFLASGVLGLGPKLGPVLWQLPPRLEFDADRVEAFLAMLPQTTAAALELARGHDSRMTDRTILEIDADRPLRHAIEPRHDSFHDPRFFELLRRYGVACVLADAAADWVTLDVDIERAGLRYARLHGGTELYASGYHDPELDRWAERVRAWTAAGHDAYVYFDNDAKVRAPVDAMGLIRRLS